MEPYFVQFKQMFFWVMQALLKWTEEDHTEYKGGICLSGCTPLSQTH